MIFIILIILLVVIIGGYVILYNNLQTAKVNTEEAWSQIDVQLQRRNDLIPNLVEATKGYAKHERETFEEVVKLRNKIMTLPADAHQEKMEISNQLTDALKSIFALSENYPDLKASQQFSQLQEELTNTENKIAYSRQLFNSSAAIFNKKLVVFPSNLVAKFSHLTKIDYLQVPQDVKDVPQIHF
ncbi:LemA family protein [Ligilactobacillus cholophilus]|uniref:LemA family protein n=1 Tax=Ligilactobacillus cholophilus TaxID=3050131 RepID=UPI0025B0E0DA|nr:LemA family protein [Ligilactobacillus cholophilus]